MAAYGSETTIQELVWGGAKASVPSIVTAANNVATTIVNTILDLNADISNPSNRIVNVTNILAAEIVKNPRNNYEQIYKEAEIMLASVRDSGIPSEAGIWGNVRFI